MIRAFVRRLLRPKEKSLARASHGDRRRLLLALTLEPPRKKRTLQ